jgi:eukaryotic-like serine/threonine-protein kinase
VVIGTVLADRYELTARIASGGMADVYTATDQRLERTVAVKLLRNGEDADPAALLDELQAQGQLNHHGVVRLFDVGAHGDTPYLVMEYVAGRSLKDVIGDEPLPPQRVAEIGECLADTLATAHAAGIVHRDVKPANVLLDHDERVRLTDFGIARTAASESGGISGVTYGTAAYLAPEHVRGKSVGPPADTYALGLVLLECLTGRREFTGTPLEAAVARLSRDPEIPDALPEGWAPLLAAMTARQPEERPEAREAAQRLRALAVTAPLPRPSPGPRRHHAVIAVGSALVLAAALLTVAHRADNGPAEPPRQPAEQPADTPVEEHPPAAVEEPVDERGGNQGGGRGQGQGRGRGG